MGGAIHVDDLRTTATSSSTIYEQDEVINSFVSDSCLKLNTAKFEVVKISPYSHDTAAVQINNSTITTSNASKCLGVWWNSNLSAKNSVSDNINKARRAFFALGRLGACITPILLYGSETWLLNSTSLDALESFQHEIGCRILRVPKFYSKLAVCIAFHWPKAANRILIRKLGFLSKLLSGTKDTISHRVLTSLAILKISSRRP